VKVLVADPLAPAGVEILAVDHDVDVMLDMTKEELLKVIGNYDAIVVRSQTQVDADVIASGRNLKVIARAGVGVDNVDLDAATRSGIVVCNAPQSNIISAAEHTVALLLALARNVPQAHSALSAGRWERSRWTGTEVYGKVPACWGSGASVRSSRSAARRWACRSSPMTPSCHRSGRHAWRSNCCRPLRQC
jgi:D-3-phosphoglycerate dehydrogenase